MKRLQIGVSMGITRRVSKNLGKEYMISRNLTKSLMKCYGIGIIICVIISLLITSLDCAVYAAGSISSPQLRLNTRSEIEGSTYSENGRWAKDGVSYFEYGSRYYTHFPEAIQSGVKGLPISVSVTDPDRGMYFTGYVSSVSKTYPIKWGSLTGNTSCPTDGTYQGYAFIPLSELPEGKNVKLTVGIKKFENTWDTSPAKTVTTNVLFNVDRVAPVAAIHKENNTIRVDSCNELPARLCVQLQDGAGNWLPAEVVKINKIPTVFVYDSLTDNQANIKYWVEDQLGNKSSVSSEVLPATSGKFGYTGFSEDTRTSFSVFVNTRLGEGMKVLPQYFSFLGGLAL